MVFNFTMTLFIIFQNVELFTGFSGSFFSNDKVYWYLRRDLLQSQQRNNRDL